MNNILGPEKDLGASERALKCRSEVEAAMLRLIAAATKLGWTEIEVTIALADAAEDRVIELASTTRHTH